MKPSGKYSAAILSPHTIAPGGDEHKHSVTLGARFQAETEFHALSVASHDLCITKGWSGRYGSGIRSLFDVIDNAQLRRKAT